jgi:deoxyadenosine/deoxycytidine kinase
MGDRDRPLTIRYIAIEGVPGVGKTRLARILETRLNARLVLENSVENPFLPLFYEDPQRYGFQTQVFFLLMRFRQQQELHQIDLFQSVVVSNYLFDRDGIYAHVILNDDELSLYNRLAETLEGSAARPDLVIYLQDSVENTARRIRSGEAVYEHLMTEEHLVRLTEAYNHYFFHYTETPLLVYNISEVDFVGRPHDLEDLLQQIASPPAGTRYYRPIQGSSSH